MASGITSTGFQKKTYNQILAEIISDTQAAFGIDFDLRESTPAYQIAASRARAWSEFWDQLENLYNQRRVTNATGQELDYAVRVLGLRRIQPQKASGQVTITGTNGVTIPVGFLVQTDSGKQYESLETKVITGGVATVIVRALLAGTEGNVAAGSIVVITNPTVGVASVTNANPTSNGVDREEDVDLRERYFLSLSRGGGSTTDAIRAALLEVLGVQDALVRENDTNATAGGIPAKSIAPVVLGGLNDDIHDSLFASKAGGIQCFGSITKAFIDDSGNNITIGFERPTDIDVWIRATVTPNSSYPVDGDDQVQAIIVNAINNLDIAEPVILFELSFKVGSGVTGITNLLLESSLDGVAYNVADVMITGIEKAVTENAKVTVI